MDFPVSVKRVEEQECDCDHSFVLKDDMGLVCRICGIIQKGIEEIIDYQWSKVWKDEKLNTLVSCILRE